MMYRISAAVAFALVCLEGGVNAADVTMGETMCDGTLPIYAKNLVLDCGNEGDGCTLGEYAGISATVKYNGVYNVVTNNKAYTTVSVSKYKSYTSYVTDYSLSKTLYSLREISVCSSMHSENGGCPADGSYTYQGSELLPSLSDKDWFLTGQHFEVEIKIYSDEDGTNLIGDCSAQLTTKVTVGASKYMDPPDAATTMEIVGLFALVAALGVCAGCWWMDQRDQELEANDFEMLEDPRAKQNAVV
uniref:Uncharacterized protein n=1 Tax=Trieres chinensis TaxID=1514140 RepID=A0A7S1ZD25_TRICV